MYSHEKLVDLVSYALAEQVLKSPGIKGEAWSFQDFFRDKHVSLANRFKALKNCIMKKLSHCF